jgi:hypothetical protein
MRRSRSDGIFSRVRGIPILLWVVRLAALFLLVGCTDGGSQAHQNSDASHSDNVKLELRPEHDSGVSGTASFGDTSNGVLVKLELRNLPKPNTLYLAHIHPGTCAEGESHEHGGAHGEGEHGHEHSGSSHQHGGSSHEHGESTHEHSAAEIEDPLSQVKSDSEGRGSSTTTLHETSVDKLFSGEPKHVNVHEAGSGNPPILSCANLKRAG